MIDKILNNWKQKRSLQDILDSMAGGFGETHNELYQTVFGHATNFEIHQAFENAFFFANELKIEIAITRLLNSMARNR